MEGIEIRKEGRRYQIYCDGHKQDDLWASGREKVLRKAFYHYAPGQRGDRSLKVLTKDRLLELASSLGCPVTNASMSKDEMVGEIQFYGWNKIIQSLNNNDLARIGDALGLPNSGNVKHRRWSLGQWLLEDLWREPSSGEQSLESAESSEVLFISRKQQLEKLPSLIDTAEKSVVVIAWKLEENTSTKSFLQSLSDAHEKKDVSVCLYLDGRLGSYGMGRHNLSMLTEFNPKLLDTVKWVSTHAKSVVIDNKKVMLGSSNFDGCDPDKPKPFDVNILLESEHLAAEIIRQIGQRLTLDEPSKPRKPPKKRKSNKRKRRPKNK